jgi:S1-C subfamily serine protease
VELCNPGPLLQAFFGEATGALVMTVRRLSTAERAGLCPGDLIHQVGFQAVQDAVTARRFLTRAATTKPQFDVHLHRYFAKAPPCRIVTRRNARR